MITIVNFISRPFYYWFCLTGYEMFGNKAITVQSKHNVRGNKSNFRENRVRITKEKEPKGEWRKAWNKVYSFECGTVQNVYSIWELWFYRARQAKPGWVRSNFSRKSEPQPIMTVVVSCDLCGTGRGRISTARVAVCYCTPVAGLYKRTRKSDRIINCRRTAPFEDIITSETFPCNGTPGPIESVDDSRPVVSSVNWIRKLPILYNDCNNNNVLTVQSEWRWSSSSWQRWLSVIDVKRHDRNDDYNDNCEFGVDRLRRFLISYCNHKTEYPIWNFNAFETIQRNIAKIVLFPVGLTDFASDQ